MHVVFFGLEKEAIVFREPLRVSFSPGVARVTDECVPSVSLDMMMV